LEGPSDEALVKFFSEDARKFEPSDLDIFITNSKGEQQRLIFYEPIVLKTAELKQLEGFRDFLNAKGLTIPPG
jgi:hypothetical protein